MHGGTNSMVVTCYKEKKESRTAESNVTLSYTSDQKDLYCYKSDVCTYTTKFTTFVECSNQLTAHLVVRHLDVTLPKVVLVNYVPKLYLGAYLHCNLKQAKFVRLF